MPLASNTPSMVKDLLDLLATDLPALLPETFTGLYLYGSLTQDAFQPARSDIDAIAVTEVDLSEAEFASVGEWIKDRRAEGAFAGWLDKLQLLFLVRSELLQMNGKASLFQHGQWERSGSDGNPIVWLNILESGLALGGPEPAAILPPITEAMMHEALVRELGYLSESLADPQSEWRDRPVYRSYAVLTVCRILCSHVHGGMRIVSKPVAADWARENLGKEWHSLIEDAEAVDKCGKNVDIDIGRTRNFVDWAQARVEPGG